MHSDLANGEEIGIALMWMRGGGCAWTGWGAPDRSPGAKAQRTRGTDPRARRGQGKTSRVRKLLPLLGVNTVGSPVGPSSAPGPSSLIRQSATVLATASGCAQEGGSVVEFGGGAVRSLGGSADLRAAHTVPGLQHGPAGAPGKDPPIAQALQTSPCAFREDAKPEAQTWMLQMLCPGLLMQVASSNLKVTFPTLPIAK